MSRRAYYTVLAAGLLFMLAANLPGHLSYDSLVALTEGRFHQRITWAPAFYSWTVGLFDRWVPGTGLYVAVSALLLSLALASFAALRGRVSWAGVLVAAGVVLTPQLMIYQAIVWKDVFFANLTVAGFVCLAFAAAGWRRPWARLIGLALALALLSCAALTRQNGVLAGLAACVALGWVGARAGGALRGWLWGVGGAAALVVCAWGVGAYATPTRVPADDGVSKGVLLIQNYDLLGALALDPKAPLAVIEARNPAAAAAMRAQAPRFYSPERVDYLDDDPALAAIAGEVSPETTALQWRKLLLKRPDLYLRHRLEVFRWVFATPVIDRCLPIFVGVDLIPDRTGPLGLTAGRDPADLHLFNYATWFLDTPAFSHVAFAALALGVGAALLWRREPADLVMAAMLAGALAFAGSFFMISLACDYRYLYFLDLAAMAGTLYLAVDPRLRRTR